MRFRNVRIAWSVVWGVVAVLLCVLWVRSYSGRTTHEILVTPNYRCYVTSLAGTVALEREQRIFLGVELFRGGYKESDFLYLATNAGIKVHRDYTDRSISGVSISYWLLVAASLGVGGLPWLRCRFSLRTLLIVTTLVGAGLGLVVWGSRSSG